MFKDNYITDTLPLVLRLEKRILPLKAKRIFELTEISEVRLNIPVPVLDRIGYLAQQKIISTGLDDVKRYCDSYPEVRIINLNTAVSKMAAEKAELIYAHEKLLAGFSVYLNAEIVTNNYNLIHTEDINCIWQ